MTTKAGKNPKGGLTAKGRAQFAKSQGAHLKPGVRGPADTPEKLRRKGSYLRRFFGRSKLPALKDAQGKPTRFALSAHAWGEPVPKTEAAARRLAQKGERLLQRYERQRARTKKSGAGSRARSRAGSGSGSTGRS